MRKPSQESSQKARKFIQIPKYPGGKAAFQQFIRENLRYPEDAVKNKIEGIVFLAYQVDGLGNVLEVVVEKGIGYGCDEEAVRVIELMKYEKVKNRGFRITATMRTRIRFEMKMIQQQLTLQYQVTAKKEKATQEQKKPESGNISYTINF